MSVVVFDFACGSSGLGCYLVLESSRRGVASVSSWHPKVLPSDHLPRKMPHIQRIWFVVVVCGCVCVFVLGIECCVVVVCCCCVL